MLVWMSWLTESDCLGSNPSGGKFFISLNLFPHVDS